MKSLNSIKWMLLFFMLPSLVWAQKQERQMGDTTFYKNDDSQSPSKHLLKNVSMIANMNLRL
jgi:hypothetical protein